jgi:hypothetical protein
MSSIEERLARDIEAITAGVVVTESDLRDAREAVAERIDSRRQRGRTRILVAAAVAAVVGVAALQTLGGDDDSAPPADPGPTTEGDPHALFLTGNAPTPELINGVWQGRMVTLQLGDAVGSGAALMLFEEDGTMRSDSSGTLFSDPDLTGTYEVKDDVITVTMDGGPAECIGEQFAVRASLPADGEMRFVHTGPAVDGCSPAQDERWVLDQVLPTNNEHLGELEVPEEGDWQSLTESASLYGDWVADRTDPAGDGGHVLEIAPNGSYTVAAGFGLGDDSNDVGTIVDPVVDRGRWTFDSAASRLDLVSAGDSPTCDQGDRLVLVGLQQPDDWSSSMRSTVQQDDCGGAWASVGWIRLW